MQIARLHQSLSYKVPVELKGVQKWMGDQNSVDTYDRSKVPKNSINHQYRIVTANKQRHKIRQYWELEFQLMPKNSIMSLLMWMVLVVVERIKSLFWQRLDFQHI